MAYVGQAPIEQFSSVPTKDSFTGDGSTVAFDLSNQVAAAGDNSIEVFVDNVRHTFPLVTIVRKIYFAECEK